MKKRFTMDEKLKMSWVSDFITDPEEKIKQLQAERQMAYRWYLQADEKLGILQVKRRLEER